MNTLAELIGWLKRPEVYPHPVNVPVHALQTQMSVIFLTGTYVYKIKKPVDLGYLNYSSLQQRLRFCLAELELNRRLCPEAYLDVLSLVRDGETIKFSDRNDEAAIEYAVKMIQLPLDRMMDRLLEKDLVTPEMVRSVARKIAAFHARTGTDKYIDSFGEPCSIKVNTEENFEQTEDVIGKALSEGQYARIRRYTESFLRSHGELMHQRILGGRIRDCHGDLHAAHVCFNGEDICIYDCIEFNERFRYADVASEVAFLAMDLDKHQRPDLSGGFVDAYVEFSSDQTLRRMIPFYQCYRAYVRGKVEGFKMADAYISDQEKSVALENARKYFALAFKYASRKPTLIIMIGLAGTGKTTVARTLGETLGAQVVSSDVVRKRLAGIPETTHAYQPFQAGIYSPSFSEKTYEVLFEEARQTLAGGETLILDATFLRTADRKQARQIAKEYDARFLAIECVLPESEARRRIEMRMKETSTSDADWNVYLKQKSSFEELSDMADTEHIVIDFSANWDNALSKIVELTE